MKITPRPYQGLRDFIAMRSILVIGRKMDTTSYYVHAGDLSWWIFCSDYEDTHWQEHAYIWERDGQTIGWTLLDPHWRSFDVYLLPDLHGSTIEEYILDWSITRLSKIVRGQGHTEIQTMWVAAHDTNRICQLEKRKFQRGEYAMWYLERPLRERLPEPRLPNGFQLRQISDGEDIKPRAAAAHQALAAHKPFDVYWPLYQRFVDSPVYISSLDLVTVAPEGNFSSFCIAWPDPVNHVGMFEPVGTHPDFESQGLGRAVVTEGLHQLQDCGMERAAACVETDDLAAQDLYQAVGFKKQYQLNTYVKTII